MDSAVREARILVRMVQIMVRKLIQVLIHLRLELILPFALPNLIFGQAAIFALYPKHLRALVSE